MVSGCLLLSLGGAAGCRVDEDDVRRWETTQRGPDKLEAVLFHEKYDVALRVEAALSLIRMKPRGGRAVGIPILVSTLADIPPDSRQAIVAALVPAIITELKKPPPVAQAGQVAPLDDSFAYKDAAYAMLTDDRTVLVADEGLKSSLKSALIEWAMADFEHRLTNRTQSYGMEQLLRYLGSESVKGLPSMMTASSLQVDAMARLVAELGDTETKEKASAALVQIASYVISEEWIKKKTPELQAANAASKLEPNAEQFKAQLEKFQDEELMRTFGSMKRVGGRPVVDFGLSFAAKKEQNEKRRQAALASLEGHLDRKNEEDINRIIEIAKSDAPNVVLDQAFRRIGEMPREVVVDRLYKIFGSDQWKIRRAAAATVIKMSTVKHIPEFMGHLPKGAAKGFALPEAIAYGANLGDLKEGNALEALKPYFTKGDPAVRTSALAYYLTHGTKKDVGAVEPFKDDRDPVPECDTDNDCKWGCYVTKEGAKDPNDKELKEIKTIGEFVTFCILPTMSAKDAAAKDAAAKKEEGAPKPTGGPE